MIRPYVWTLFSDYILRPTAFFAANSPKRKSPGREGPYFVNFVLYVVKSLPHNVQYFAAILWRARQEINYV